MPEMTKAQLRAELKNAKEANKNLTFRLEEKQKDLIAADGEVAEVRKTNAELGCRIGQLESELAELTAFKQDALAAMERQGKEIDFLTAKAVDRRSTIKKQGEMIRELEDEKETLKFDISVHDARWCDLMNGSILNFLKWRHAWRKDGAK